MAVCAQTQVQFDITSEDKNFYDAISPVINGVKYTVPDPKLCPRERQRRRSSYRNFRNLYRRRCQKTGRTIVSMYREDQPFPVYANDVWWGDDWSALEYGKSFDFSRPFFEQYAELARSVPRHATMNVQCENCEYSNLAMYSKDSYLVFGCVRDEECLYGHIVWDSQQCVDNLYLYKSSWCSECIDCAYSYNLHYSQECMSCSDSYFLFDCQNCQHCFGCSNLRNQSYCIHNKQFSKEQYQQKLQEILPKERDEYIACADHYRKHWKAHGFFPKDFSKLAEDCTGNHIYESKNCQCAFDAKQSEDSKFLYTSFKQLNSYDISFTGMESRWCYECLTIGNNERCMGSHNIFDTSDTYYSEFCQSSHYLFGCNGLRSQKYCILNTSYLESEYSDLMARIIHHMQETGEWGDFFPIKDSPFAYNESIVSEYIPLSQGQVIANGWKWLEPEGMPDVATPSSKDPSIVTCPVSKKPFKVTPQEAKWYGQMKLPLPIHHPDTRHESRMKERFDRSLVDVVCGWCGNGMQSAHGEVVSGEVLCEGCYRGRLY
jgi:hypothetical protein